MQLKNNEKADKKDLHILFWFSTNHQTQCHFMRAYFVPIPLHT